MKRIRQVLFWTHLVAGLIAGLSIAIMCFTGTVLAFEHEIVEWAERDARRVAVPAESAPRLSLAELQQRLHEAQPELRTPAITLRNDPAAAITFSAGRNGGFYANPSTGEIRQPASTKVHDFMHVMVDWHRYLALSGDHRPTGKVINGICNLAFFGLALTGLWLWWPRSWSWRGVKAITLLNWKLTGKSRDFNWHNAIGLWTAPLLIVLTLTAVPISFRWGGDLIYRIAGETPPAAPAGPGGGSGTAPTVEIPRPSPDARPVGYDAIAARVQQEFPRWQSISLRTGSPQRGPRPAAPPGAAATSPQAGFASGQIPNPESKIENDAGRSTPPPITVIIRETGSWPRTATTTLTVHPFTGETLATTAFADLSTARQIRSWTRYLHTGEALGWGGQLIAGLACLGGLFLVYTGFALSWRRFFPQRKKPAA